jgi:hypothetical protein
MMENSNGKLQLFQAFGVWILVLVVGGWLLFKPDTGLSKDTVTKLTTAVDGIATAADNISKIANSQREWYGNLQRTASLQDNKRDGDYNELYNKYEYGKDDTTLSLNDIYDRRMHEQAQNLGSQHVRGIENTTGKTGSVQEPAGNSKG